MLVIDVKDLHLFVVANGRDGDGLADGLPPLFEGDNLTAALVESLDDAAVVAQVLTQVLHLLQQLLALIQRELALAVSRVQQLILPARINQIQSLFISNFSIAKFNVHDAPLLALVHFGEEVVVDAGVAEVRLQAEGQLEQPVPLRLQRRHVRLDALGRRVMLQHQRLSSILHGAHLNLPLLQFTHQSLRCQIFSQFLRHFVIKQQQFS